MKNEENANFNENENEKEVEKKNIFNNSPFILMQ